MNRKVAQIVAFIALLLVAGASRLIPHLWNVTAVGAVSLLGGAYFGRKAWALIIPVAAVWMSDIVLNNTLYASYYAGWSWMTSGFVWIVLGIIATMIVGRLLLKTSKSYGRLFLASVVGAVMFYLLTNLGAWMTGVMYPKSIGGLVACYVAGLPFLLNSLLGNLVFCAVLFPVYQWYATKYGLHQTELSVEIAG